MTLARPATTGLDSKHWSRAESVHTPRFSRRVAHDRCLLALRFAARPAARELFDEMARWPIFDPHSHIDPHRPAAAESRRGPRLSLLYRTRPLRGDAGRPRSPPISMPARTASATWPNISIGSTIPSSIPGCWRSPGPSTSFHTTGSTPETIGELYDRARPGRDGGAWDREVWQASRLEAVFLTNEFDDPLEGWDTTAVRPLPADRRPGAEAARAPDGRAAPERNRGRRSGPRQSARGDRRHLRAVHPPRGAGLRDQPAARLRPPPGHAQAAPSTPVRRAIQDLDLRPDEHEEIRSTVFWMLAEFCAEFRLPFDLMIGPIRNVYPAGVSGGRDLFDRRVSLYDYRELFNHFATVMFPVSTLAPDAAAELVAYSWIFPNVLPMGHWWYSNIPAFIAADLKARIQALPKVKLLGYYSDAYKLEFILPKFNMYRRILAETLAEECMRGRGWPLDRTLQLGKLILLDNPRRVFAGNASGSGATI